MSQFDDIYKEAKKRLGAGDELYENVWTYAWPEVFGSTLGPRPGIGGQMLSKFQVFAFEFEDGEKNEIRGVAWCAGVWRKWDRAKNGLKWPK